VGREHLPAHAAHAALLEDQLGHGPAGGQMDASGGPVRLEATDEGLDHARPGAPGDVETGHRVAMSLGATVTALGPAHDREAAEPHPPPPGTSVPPRAPQV